VVAPEAVGSTPPLAPGLDTGGSKIGASRRLAVQCRGIGGCALGPFSCGRRHRRRRSCSSPGDRSAGRGAVSTRRCPLEQHSHRALHRGGDAFRPGCPRSTRRPVVRTVSGRASADVLVVQSPAGAIWSGIPLALQSRSGTPLQQFRHQLDRDCCDLLPEAVGAGRHHGSADGEVNRNRDSSRRRGGAAPPGHRLG
jgi:hypothetical protein